MGLSTTGAGRIVKKQESDAGQGDASAFSKKEPALSAVIEESRSVFSIRKINRLLLARRYAKIHPSCLPPELIRYPKMQKQSYIESISQQPSELVRLLEENQINPDWTAKDLAKKLHKGNGTARREAAEKLALIASDPEVYYIRASMAALKSLVMEASKHSSQEAMAALESLGIMDKLTNDELKAIKRFPTGAWFVIKCIFSPRLKEIASYFEEKIRNGF